MQRHNILLLMYKVEVLIVCINQLIEYLIIYGTVVTGDYHSLYAAWQTLKLIITVKLHDFTLQLTQEIPRIVEPRLVVEILVKERKRLTKG